MPPPSPSAEAALHVPFAPASYAAANIGFIRSRSFWGKLAAAAGPGYLIAVGYMDPGNWATDIAAGSKFGFALLPIIVLSNFAAMFLQWLSLRLGIATGRDLAQHCRSQYSPLVARALWVLCETAIIACDLAEVIGTAIALKLLFHCPMVLGVILTASDTFLILALQKFGVRRLESFIIALVAIIAACFVYELAACHPALNALLSSFIPSGQTPTSPMALYLALGIFGATVMPHNLYLHSSIAQSRVAGPGLAHKREAIRFCTIDCIAALTFALLINAAILITAASAFHWSGHSGVQTIEEAYKLLTPILGPAAASIVFAVALLAAGQNSTVTGTMAGQIAMEGFLGLKMNLCGRRMLTRGIAIVPALLVTAIAGENATSQLLLLSQVVLSLQLGFAVIPLVSFTGNAGLMGPLVNSRWTKLVGYGLGGVIIGANIWLVFHTAL